MSKPTPSTFAAPLAIASGPLSRGQQASFLNRQASASTMSPARRIGVQATQYRIGQGYNRANKRGAIAT